MVAGHAPGHPSPEKVKNLEDQQNESCVHLEFDLDRRAHGLSPKDRDVTNGYKLVWPDGEMPTEG